MAKSDESTCTFRGQMYNSGSWVCETRVCAKCDNGKWATSPSDYSTANIENK